MTKPKQLLWPPPVLSTLQCDQCGAVMSHHGTWETMVGFGRDEKGHRHDDNCQTREYVCWKGHVKKLSVRRVCEEPEPCDWKGKEQCFCHPGKKLDAWPPDA